MLRSTSFALTALLTLASPAAVFAQPKASEKANNAKSGGTSATNTSSPAEGKKGGNPDPGGPNPNSKGNSSANAGATGGGGPANAKPATAAVEKGNEKAKGPNENASDNAKAIHAALDKFKAERTKLLDERNVLLEKLKKATEAEKKELLEQLRLDSNAREEEQRALARQVREELKKSRDDRKGGS